MSIQNPQLCPECDGHGRFAHNTVTRSLQSNERQPDSPHAGQPWNRSVDESRDARIQAIIPVSCANCNGTGLV